MAGPYDPDIRGGVGEMTVDGQTMDVVSSASYSCDDGEEESQLGMTGYQGTKFNPKACFIEAEVRNSVDLDIASLRGGGHTVVLALRNTKTVIGSNLRLTTQVEVDTAEGTLKLRYEGASVTES